VVQARWPVSVATQRPGTPPSVQPSTRDDCYSQAAWAEPGTEQNFPLHNFGFLNVQSSAASFQYLPGAAVPCGGVVSYVSEYSQLTLTDGPLLPPGTPPSRSACQAGDSDGSSEIKLERAHQGRFLCAKTSSQADWVVIKLVDLSDLPNTVKLQLTGYFPV